MIKAVISAPNQYGYYSIHNLPSFKFECTQMLRVSVTYNDGGIWEDIYKGSYTPFSSRVSFEIKDVVSSHLSTSQPSQPYGDFYQNMCMKNIRVQAEDDDGDSWMVDFYVMNFLAKINTSSFLNAVTKRFLTIQPSVKHITVESPEFLSYFYHTTARLVVKFYLIDGTTEQVTLFNYNHQDYGRVYTHYVAYERVMKASNVPSSQKKPYYDVFVVNSKGTRISEIQRYIYEDPVSSEFYYLFINQMGGIDTLTCTGVRKQLPEVTYNLAKLSNEFSQLDDTDDSLIYQQNTGYFSADHLQWLIGFVMSKKGRWLYNATKKKATAIVMKETDAELSERDSFVAMSFSYIMASGYVMEVDESIIEAQQLYYDTKPQSSESNVIKGKDIGVTPSGNDSYVTESIECTMNTMVFDVQTEGWLKIYTSTDGETWTLLDTYDVDGETSITLDELELGSFIKFESETDIETLKPDVRNAEDNN